MKQAVEHPPAGHRHWHQSHHLLSLGITLKLRFECHGEPSDLEDAIVRMKDALDLTLDGHPHNPPYLISHEKCFRTRFQRLYQLQDLDQVISRISCALILIPVGFPGKVYWLYNLGVYLKARFDRLGELDDLNGSITVLNEAVELTPDNHPYKAKHLNTLGISFEARFERLGGLCDLEDAISKFRVAKSLTAEGPNHNPCWLHNLGSSLEVRFTRLGQRSDLEEAILNLKAAVDLSPDDHPHKPQHVNSLGSSLAARAALTGDLGDLEEAILMSRNAVDLSRAADSDRAHYLTSLGINLRARFDRHGELGDLEEAISIMKGAIDLTPNGDQNKPCRLQYLSGALKTRFQRLRELSDIEDAISRMRDAVELTPQGHPHVPYHINGLGNCLVARFRHSQRPADIDEAVSRMKDAANLIPDGHILKPFQLNDLNRCLKLRFDHLGEKSDLEQAIEMMKKVIDPIPDGQRRNPFLLHDLGDSLQARFDHFGELSDLDKASVMLKVAVDLTPDDHPEKTTHLNSFAYSCLARFNRLGVLSDLHQAMALYSQAACSSTGLILSRFSASEKWILCARSLAHSSLLDAYSCAISLLPQLAWIGAPLAERYRDLSQGSDVARQAAAAALDLGHVQVALEWLEQGRSIVWGELFQLRDSFEELSAAHPELALRLRKISSELENAGATREKFLSSLSDCVNDARIPNVAESLEQEASRHRNLALQRDKLLQEIRELPGFDGFMHHKKFSQLRASACFGPVVFLNSTKTRCDALIVREDMDDVIHVPLHNFTLERSMRLQTTLKGLIPREGKPVRLDHSGKWKSILSILWRSIVKPVLEVLGFSTPGNLSRIFWCPSGPLTFLPIHAAGLYDEQQPGHKLSDFAISSYIPSLAILAPSPGLAARADGDVRFLAVPQPSSDGHSPLPAVSEEMRYIEAAVQRSPFARTTLVQSSEGTVEEVLGLVKEADWVHFACHGMQDNEKPANSGLCLADGRQLKLSDMISLSRPRGGLAFLSACQTAMGDKTLSDEAIHIAAAMLFSGFEGVIATMWAIDDSLAPQVARDVYEELFRKDTKPDSREAARALQDAVGHLRAGGASFEKWLPFIHVGL